MTWTVVVILLCIVVVDCVLRLPAARLILPRFEQKPPFGRPPRVDTDLDEVVWLETTNGLKLRGRIYRQTERKPRGVIVFCPEMEGDSRSALHYCQALFDAGYDLFAFDFRNQGESDCLPGYEPMHWLTEFEVDDALAAVRYVRLQEEWAALPLGIVGISRGGGAALAAAARTRDIRAVVVEGAFTTHHLMEYYTQRWAALFIPQWLMNLFPLWHVRITLALARRISETRRRCRYVKLEREVARLDHKPVLMIHGERDSYVPKETAHELARRLPNNRQVWFVPKTNHNKARETHPDEFDRRLVEFFDHLHHPHFADELDSARAQHA